MKLTFKAILLTSALALSTLFTGNALATNESCETCTAGNAPNTSVHTGVNAAMMACSSCHTRRATPATPATPATGTMVVRRTSEGCSACTPGTAPAISAHKNVTATTVCSVCHVSGNTGIKIRPTSHSCDDCLAGMAPASVSAHKNVNSTNTLCAVCHGVTGGTTGGHSDEHHSSSGNHVGNRPDSPGNSEFGHSHKRDKKQHRDRSN